jgi:hypothetical protein
MGTEVAVLRTFSEFALCYNLNISPPKFRCGLLLANVMALKGRTKLGI